MVNEKSNAVFQFQIKRGVIDLTEVDPDDQPVVDEIIDLCKQGRAEDASLIAIDAMFFECDFYNLDCDPSEIFVDPEVIEFDCGDNNCFVEVGYHDDNLVLTFSVEFKAEVYSTLTAQEIQEVLSEQGGWSCATVNPFMFAGDDGTNMWITRLRSEEVDHQKS